MYKFQYVLMNESVEGGEGGATEGAAPAPQPGGKMYSADEVRALVDEQVRGLKSKNSELLGKLKQFDGLDADRLKDMLSKIDQSEEAKLLAEGKLDDVIAKRTDRIRADAEARLEEVEKARVKYEQEAQIYRQRFESRVIEDAIKQEAMKQGVRPEALDDVVRRGADVFKWNAETNEVEARDGNGNLLRTQDENGYIMTPEYFVRGLMKTAPYYWPNSDGGGTVGARGASAREDLAAKLQDAANRNDMAAYKKIREQMQKTG